MTYEELLTRIKHYEVIPLPDMLDDRDELAAALRAVVELHKPIKKENINNSKEWFECSFCNDSCWGCEEWGCSDCFCNCHKNSRFYPCPTIQAIEKELA